MKDLRIKHLFVEPEDWSQLKEGVRQIFWGEISNLDGCDGILLTTDKFKDLKNLGQCKIMEATL